jgi:hypothetical protein
MSLSLRSLCDADILSRTQTLVSRERAMTLQLLLHLNEIEKRKLHLKQGYSSMFDYCTSGLRYSEAAAVRRIRTARCVARFPEVFGLLESNDMNLSTISRISRVLTAENKDAVLSRARKRSQREVEAIVAEYQPRTMLRDIVRPVVLRLRAGVAASAISATTAAPDRPAIATCMVDSAPKDACEKDAYRRCDGDYHPTGVVGAKEGITEKRIQFQFSATEAFREKLEKVKSLAWHRLPANPSLEQVFGLALEFFIERQDPSERRARRETRRASAMAASMTGVSERVPDGSRHVAAAVKDEVFMRDGNRCQYVAPNGRRCTARSALQLDHIKPIARGGASTLDNLRLLCASHNRLESERLMGPLPRRRE